MQYITSEFKEGYYELFPRTDQGEFAWKNVKESFDDSNKGNYFKAEKDGDKILLFHKYYEQQVFKNVWTDKKYQSEFQGHNLLKKLIGENKFSYPKSLYAVVDVIKIMTKPNDIVMDFFGGSGTTAHAVSEVNLDGENKRNFILIEQLDEHIDIVLRRMNKIIADTSESFIYLELKKYNQIFVEKIEAAESTDELLQIWEEMKAKSFLDYNVDIKRQDEHTEEFKALNINEQKRHLIEILDKNQLYVNLSSMNDKDFEVTEEEKQVTRDFYQIK